MIIEEFQTSAKPNYHHRFIGNLPTGWRIDKLVNVAEVTQGVSKGRELKDKKVVRVPYLRVANVLDGEFDLSEIKEIELLQSEHSRYLIKPDDILITEGGDPDKLGRGGIWKLDIKGLVFQNHLFRIRCNANQLIPDFLSYFIQTQPAKNYFLSCAKQTTGIASINMGQIRATPVPIPPVNEQRVIVNTLSSFDVAIQTAKKLLTAKQERKRGLMDLLLTGQKRLPGFSGDWKEVYFTDLLREVKRPVKWNDDEIYNLLSVRRRSGGVFFRESLLGREILTKNLRTAKAGEFLISKMQIVHGASGLVRDEHDGMKISGSYIAVVSQDPNLLDIEFFDWYSQLKSFYRLCYTSSYGVHIEKMTFDFDDFLKRKIAIPPTVEEQRSITNILNAADKEIRLADAEKKALQEQKRGLMQVLLTGKKLVTVNELKD